MTANHVDQVANIDDDLRPGCDLDKLDNSTTDSQAQL
jgi:hypothetical protein